jgi:hypothetical protein
MTVNFTGPVGVDWVPVALLLPNPPLQALKASAVLMVAAKAANRMGRTFISSP